jgi:hypothetical protein
MENYDINRLADYSAYKIKASASNTTSIIFKLDSPTIPANLMKKIICTLVTLHLTLVIVFAQPVTQEWVRRYDNVYNLNYS